MLQRQTKKSQVTVCSEKKSRTEQTGMHKNVSHISCFISRDEECGKIKNNVKNMMKYSKSKEKFKIEYQSSFGCILSFI